MRRPVCARYTAAMSSKAVTSDLDQACADNPRASILEQYHLTVYGFAQNEPQGRRAVWEGVAAYALLDASGMLIGAFGDDRRALRLVERDARAPRATMVHKKHQ